MRPPRTTQRGIRFTPNRADAHNMTRIAEAARVAPDSPPPDAEAILRLSLHVATRVIEAGEADRVRAVPVTFPTRGDHA